MTRLKSLVAYDLVDIKGVINVLSVNKPSICPSCGEKNVKVFGVSCFIYPITVIKLDGYFNPATISGSLTTVPTTSTSFDTSR